MRKWLGLLLLCGLAGKAQAQSSVSLYGRLDAGLEYLGNLQTSDGSSAGRWKAESGDYGTSLFGMKGYEYLGGDLTANFVLEGSFHLNDGTSTHAGTLFDRKALVGLSGEHWGAFSIGRNLFISNGVWDFDPFQQQAFSSASLVKGRNWPQASNTVNYKTPNIGGFEAVGQYGFSNVAGQFNNGRSGGMQVSYINGPFLGRVMYDEIRDSNGAFSDVFAASREYFAGGKMAFGSWTVQVAYTHMAAADAAVGTPTRADHMWVGVTDQLNADWSVSGAVYHVNVPGGYGHATMFELGTLYSLSKRTFLYATVAQVRNQGPADFSVAVNYTAEGNPAAGANQTGAYFGISHSF